MSLSVRVIIVISIVLLFIGCKGKEDTKSTKLDSAVEVEIAPGKWLLVAKEGVIYASGAEGQTSLQFEWKGKNVIWCGPEIPMSLREYQGTMYMIGLNREDLNNAHYVYFNLNDEKSSMTVISANEYPKKIATQNMWLSNYSDKLQHIGIYGLVDVQEGLRKLDVENPSFGTFSTARFWYHLETGEQPDVFIDDVDFLREYKSKYKPIALPTICKEWDKPSSSPSADSTKE